MKHTSYLICLFVVLIGIVAFLPVLGGCKTPQPVPEEQVVTPEPVPEPPPPPEPIPEPVPEPEPVEKDDSLLVEVEYLRTNIQRYTLQRYAQDLFDVGERRYREGSDDALLMARSAYYRVLGQAARAIEQTLTDRVRASLSDADRLLDRATASAAYSAGFGSVDRAFAARERVQTFASRALEARDAGDLNRAAALAGRLRDEAMRVIAFANEASAIFDEIAAAKIRLVEARFLRDGIVAYDLQGYAQGDFDVGDRLYRNGQRLLAEEPSPEVAETPLAASFNRFLSVLEQAGLALEEELTDEVRTALRNADRLPDRAAAAVAYSAGFGAVDRAVAGRDRVVRLAFDALDAREAGDLRRAAALAVRVRDEALATVASAKESIAIFDGIAAAKIRLVEARFLHDGIVAYDLEGYAQGDFDAGERLYRNGRRLLAEEPSPEVAETPLAASFNRFLSVLEQAGLALEEELTDEVRTSLRNADRVPDRAAAAVAYSTGFGAVDRAVAGRDRVVRLAFDALDAREAGDLRRAAALAVRVRDEALATVASAKESIAIFDGIAAAKIRLVEARFLHDGIVAYDLQGYAQGDFDTADRLYRNGRRLLAEEPSPEVAETPLAASFNRFLSVLEQAGLALEEELTDEVRTALRNADRLPDRAAAAVAYSTGFGAVDRAVAGRDRVVRLAFDALDAREAGDLRRAAALAGRVRDEALATVAVAKEAVAIFDGIADAKIRLAVARFLHDNYAQNLQSYAQEEFDTADRLYRNGQRLLAEEASPEVAKSILEASIIRFLPVLEQASLALEEELTEEVRTALRNADRLPDRAAAATAYSAGFDAIDRAVASRDRAMRLGIAAFEAMGAEDLNRATALAFENLEAGSEAFASVKEAVAIFDGIAEAKIRFAESRFLRDAIVSYGLASHAQNDFDAGDRLYQDGQRRLANEPSVTGAENDLTGASIRFLSVLESAARTLGGTIRSNLLAARREADTLNAQRVSPVLYGRGVALSGKALETLEEVLSLIDRALEARNAKQYSTAVALVNQTRASIVRGADFAERARIAFLLAAGRTDRLRLAAEEAYRRAVEELDRVETRAAILEQELQNTLEEER